MKQDKIDTIRKLIKKAEGTTNPHEASAFMAKAQQIMQAEGVDMHKVRLSEIGEAKVRSKFSVSKLNPAENILMHAVADAFGCKLLWLAKKASTTIDGIRYRYESSTTWAEHILVGNKERLDLAAYAAEVLLRQLAKARQEFVTQRSRHYWNTAVQDFDDEEAALVRQDSSIRRTIRNQLVKDGDSFAMGWAFKIQEKVIKFALNDQEQLLLQDYTKDVSGEAMDKKIEDLNASYFKGVAAAEEANLHRPLGENGEEVSLLGDTKLLESR
jgi:hypothetical protein